MLVTRVVPELPLNGARCSPFRADSIEGRISESRVRARRQWIWRTGFLLAITGLMLIVLVIWRRDTDTVNLMMRVNQRATVGVQAHLNARGLLPAQLPGVEPASYMYATYTDRFYAQHTNQPVIIAASAPLKLILRPNGRCVIIYEQGQVRSEWMTITKFGEAYRTQLSRAAQFEKQRQARMPKLP